MTEVLYKKDGYHYQILEDSPSYYVARIKWDRTAAPVLLLKADTTPLPLPWKDITKDLSWVGHEERGGLLYLQHGPIGSLDAGYHLVKETLYRPKPGVNILKAMFDLVPAFRIERREPE